MEILNFMKCMQKQLKCSETGEVCVSDIEDGMMLKVMDGRENNAAHLNDLKSMFLYKPIERCNVFNRLD